MVRALRDTLQHRIKETLQKRREGQSERSGTPCSTEYSKPCKTGRGWSDAKGHPAAKNKGTLQNREGLVRGLSDTL